MYREDVGNIDFVWGTEGRGAKFKGGYGIAHIIAKRNAEGLDGQQFVSDIPNVIASGEITNRQTAPNGDRVIISDGNKSVVLSLFKNGSRKTWLVTGWDDSAYKNKKTTPNATAAVYDANNATSKGTTRSRSDADGAVSSANSIPQKAEERKTKPAAKPKADKNGFTPISNGKGKMYFEGDELTKIQEANTQAVLKAAQEFVKLYDDGKLTAKEARSKITALYNHYYSKAKVKPYTDELQVILSILLYIFCSRSI